MADEERLHTLLPLSSVNVPVDESGPVSSTVLQRSGQDPQGLLPSMVDAVPVPLLVIDEQYRLLVANRAARRLLAEEDARFLGYSVSRFLSTQRLGAAHTKLILTGNAQTYQDILTETGTERNIELQLDGLVFEGQQFLCMTIRDRTHEDRQRLERTSSSGLEPSGEPSTFPDVDFQRLERAHHLEALGHLTGALAHDFNNMLSVIAASLNAVSRKLAGGEDPSLDLTRAQEATARSVSRASEILHYTRRRDPSGERVAPAGIIRGLRGLLERAMGPGIELSLIVESEAEVGASASQFETALLNLVINARDAMPQGGRVSLRLREVDVTVSEARLLGLAMGPHLLFTVSDNGEGMSDEVRTRAFEAFYTTKGSRQGTGLGLSSVRSFMMHWGGAVRLESKAGVGTRVELYFPLH